MGHGENGIIPGGGRGEEEKGGLSNGRKRAAARINGYFHN